MVIDKNKRLLTVSTQQTQTRSYISSESNRKVYYNYNLPFIKLTGVWLLKAGFSYGDIIEVEVNEGCLTIKKTTHQWEIIGEKANLAIVNESGEPIQKA